MKSTEGLHRGCQQGVNQKRPCPARRDGGRLFSASRVRIISCIPACLSCHRCLSGHRVSIPDKEVPPHGLLLSQPTCCPVTPHPCLLQGTEASWTSWTCQTPTSTHLMGEFFPSFPSPVCHLAGSHAAPERGMPEFCSPGCAGGGDTMPLCSAEGWGQACRVGHDSGPGTRACLESFQSQKTLCLLL